MAYLDNPSWRDSASVSKSWLIQVKRMLDPCHKMWQVSKNVCIYRVLERIRISKPEAYVPFVVSFGPYHHKINPYLSKMDQHKLEAVRRMLTRLQIDTFRLIAEIQKLEREIRECYEEPINLDGENLSWMLVMDACFILEFFRSSMVQREMRDADCFSLLFQPVDVMNSMSTDILDDIMKLENQIPLFILITLLKLEFGTSERATTMLAAMLSISCFFNGYPFSSSLLDGAEDGAELKLKNYLQNESPPFHLLDLYRMVIKDLLTNSSAESGIADSWGGAANINNDHRRCGRLMNTSPPRWMQRLSSINIFPRLSSKLSASDSRSTPSAELLHKAGIKFQPGRLGFEKRRFGRSTFSLPQIRVDEYTETMLRNLVAYEECQRCSWSPNTTVISEFVRLLQDLIDSEKDVSLLRKSLVIESWMGSDDDIARIFNRLGDGITFTSISEFEVVMKEARKHYNSRWRVWWSQLKKDIFSQPWYILTLVSAILMLVMTAVQTVMTAVQTVYTLKN